MATMRERLKDALKDAMRAKEATRLSTLRLINAAIKDRDIAGRVDGAVVDDGDIVAILARMVKQRQESVRAYEEGGRLDLAEREAAEIAVIEEFLPKQLTESEIEAAINDAIAETGAQSVRDIGRVMAVLKARHTGRMDFAVAGPKVKARLG